jgi:hypothetical protein
VAESHLLAVASTCAPVWISALPARWIGAAGVAIADVALSGEDERKRPSRSVGTARFELATP